MSRHYDMSVEIAGCQPGHIEAIKAAAEQEWPFSDWFDQDGTLIASAENSLCGGECEEGFTERLSLAIWRANGEYCEVTVNATYLESLPYETHCLDQDDYERLLTQSKSTPPGTP